MTPLMAQWWDEFSELCAKKGPGGGFEPTIVQGAFMALSGGGASASAGYHDKAGCLDLRVWDRSQEQVQFMIRRARGMAAAAWLRNASHGGMDPHIHLVLGPDSPKAYGAAWQWTEYVAGRDGLASRGKDYHWRPDPLVQNWRPSPPPTTNITEALKRGITIEERKRALRRVIRRGSPKARRVARSWLAALIAKEAAIQKARAARGDLRDLEVR